MGTMGLGKRGKLSKVVTFFSVSPPISCQFHTFFIHFPKCTFGNFPFFCISPHFPYVSPFPPHFSISPVFPSPCSWAADSAAANVEAWDSVTWCPCSCCTSTEVGLTCFFLLLFLGACVEWHTSFFPADIVVIPFQVCELQGEIV